jgi:hypothetical protein
VPYSLDEHRHRFAVWAAARAAQRGFTTVDALCAALETTDIRRATSSSEALELRSSDFETLHRHWCTSICSTLSGQAVSGATFGRAAKLVGVYMKATVLMGEAATTPLGRQLHPPIDRTLLQNLAAEPRIESPHKTAWRTISWARLTEASYYELMEQLRAVLPVGAPFWMLEEFWSPTEAEWEMV